MMLKERLAVLNPATLEAGPETDALVAECLGLVRDATDGLNPDKFTSFYTEVGGHIFAYTPTYNGHFGVSANPGLAFSVLWPWLEECQNCISLFRMGPGKGCPCIRMPFYRSSIESGETDLFISADTWALALCRAVVAVAKEAI